MHKKFRTFPKSLLTFLSQMCATRTQRMSSSRYRQLNKETRI